MDELKNLKSLQDALDDYLKCISQDRTKTFLELCGKARSESAHTSFLASIIDELKDISDHQIIKDLLSLNVQKGPIATNICKVKGQITKVIVLTEQATKGVNVDNRVDLTVQCETTSGDLFICIENKVDSDEHFNKTANRMQTEAYYKTYCNCGKEQVFLYLTVDGSQCKSPYFNPITYQGLYDSVLKKIISEKKRYPISPKMRTYVKDYCNTLVAYISGSKHLRMITKL